MNECGNCLWVVLSECKGQFFCDKFVDRSVIGLDKVEKDKGFEVGSLVKFDDVPIKEKYFEPLVVEGSEGSGKWKPKRIIVDEVVVDKYAFVDAIGKYGKTGKEYKVTVIK